MFRKLTDRIASAASSVVSPEERNVQRLTAMGFGADQARQALQASNGNVDRAAERLLGSAPGPTEEQQLQQAMQASLQSSNPRTTSGVRFRTHRRAATTTSHAG